MFFKKKIIINGSNSEFGFNIALNYIKNKYFAFLLVKNYQSKKKLINLIKLFNVHIDVYEILICNITNYYQVEKIFKLINHKYENISTLINVAAINNKTNKKNDFKEYKKLFDINYFGTLSCNLLFKKFFKINNKVIINISSDVSLRGSFNYPAYASSKAAIDSITRSFSKIFSDISFYSLLLPPIANSKNLKNKNFKNHKKLIPLDKISEFIYLLSVKKLKFKSGSLILIKDYKINYEIF